MDLYIADIKKLEDSLKLETILTSLPKEDCDKILKFRKLEDRMRCALGRVMIRRLAEEEIGLWDIEIKLSENGKPYFDIEKAPKFNISHSGDLVVMAAGKYEVGVDVQKHKSAKWERLIKCFKPSEQEMIRTAEDPEACFYKIWTIKEAFFKFLGIGISMFKNDDSTIDYRNNRIIYKDSIIYFNVINMADYTISFCSGKKSEVNYASLKNFSYKL